MNLLRRIRIARRRNDPDRAAAIRRATRVRFHAWAMTEHNRQWVKVSHAMAECDIMLGRYRREAEERRLRELVRIIKQEWQA